MLDAIHRLFNHPTLRKVFVRSRVLLGIGVVVLLLRYASPHWMLAGFLVSMLGEAIQLWCFA